MTVEGALTDEPEEEELEVEVVVVVVVELVDVLRTIITLRKKPPFRLTPV